MAKFHISPDGMARRCSAGSGGNARGCRYGYSDAEHFDSKAKAESYNEVLMKGRFGTFGRFEKGSKGVYKPVSLSDSLDLDLLNKNIVDGYVSRNKHPDDDSLQVLCYSPKTQYDGQWNDATKMCRGLVVQTSQDDFGDAVIIQRPWKKFFTLQQVESGWALGDDGEDEQSPNSAEFNIKDIDFNAPATVTDKMDGSMLVLYRDPSGEPAVTTKGSFSSEQAEYFTNFLRKNDDFSETAEKLLNDYSDTTFVFEGTGPGPRRIVLEYDEDNISMIGAIGKKDGSYKDTLDYEDVWSKDKGLEMAERVPAKNLGEALQLSDRSNREGVVVKIYNDDPEKQLQIKIKQQDYLELHHLRSNFGKKTVREIISEKVGKKNVSDLLQLNKTGNVVGFSSEISSSLDKVDKLINDSEQAGDIKKTRLKMFEEALLPTAKRLNKVYDDVMSIPDNEFIGDSRLIKKNYAITLNKTIKDKNDFDVYMRLFNSRLKGDDPGNVDVSKILQKSAQNFR